MTRNCTSVGEFTPRNFMQVVTIAMKFERAQIHLSSDVFAADTVVVAKNF